MKALIKDKPEPGLVLRDIEAPQVRRHDDVQFRVDCCAICVGETKVYDWNEWAASDTTLQLPTVLGHEVSAVVSEVGDAVTQFRPGDRVVVDPLIYCGHCYQCRGGHTNLCVNREIYGKRRGAFAEYAVLPERALCPLPDQLSAEEGALLENLGVAVHAVEAVAHDPGDVAVVIGCGPIGIMTAQALAAYGVQTVITDLVAPRLAVAAEAADGSIVVDVNESDPGDIVRELSDGRGADFVIEAAATQSALEQAFDLVRDGGVVVTIGTFNRPVTFNPFFAMTRREVSLVSTIGRTWETWRRMVQLIEGGFLTLEPLITRTLPLEAYDEGFQLVKSSEVQKVLLKP